MSQYTRLASTDEQEESISQLEQAFDMANLNIVGGTTIGKYPRTVILDLTYQGSEVYIDDVGEITIGDVNFDKDDIDGMAQALQILKATVIANKLTAAK